MFTLVNRYGNVYKTVNTEYERDELIKAGYKEVEAEIDLEKMKVGELEAYAEKNNISLEGCNNKEEKLAKIKESIKD